MMVPMSSLGILGGSTRCVPSPEGKEVIIMMSALLDGDDGVGLVDLVMVDRSSLVALLE